MVLTAETDPDLDRSGPDDPTTRRRLLAAGVLALLLATGIGWWNIGGARLEAGGASYGGLGSASTSYSFGVLLRPDDGGTVELVDATASVDGAATVDFAVVGDRGGLGFGTHQGDLEPTWLTAPVAGARISRGEVAWLVVTVSPNASGSVLVDDIVVRYRSGPRTRAAHAATSACIRFGAAPPSDDEAAPCSTST
jgi:hypothetical protein